MGVAHHCRCMGYLKEEIKDYLRWSDKALADYYARSNDYPIDILRCEILVDFQRDIRKSQASAPSTVQTVKHSDCSTGEAPEIVSSSSSKKPFSLLDPDTW